MTLKPGRITEIFMLAAVALFAGCRPGTDAPEYVFRLGHVANTDHTWHKATEYFSEILHERSKGRISVEVYPNEQLGKEIELIRSIKTGIADMTITGGTLQNWTDIVAFSDMPFVFRDTTHMRKLADGPLGKIMAEKILEETGIRVVTYFARGPRHLTSNRPVRHPSELNGLIIRIPNVPTYTVAWSALGANPTPMALSEVFTALQQGTIEAQENPLAMIRSTNLYEVQDYVNLTAHVLSWAYVVVGNKQFEKMPAEWQDLFMEAARDMQRYEHRLFLEKEHVLREDLESKGMTFIEVDQQAFRDTAVPAVYNSLTDEMTAFYDKIMNIE